MVNGLFLVYRLSSVSWKPFASVSLDVDESNAQTNESQVLRTSTQIAPQVEVPPVKSPEPMVMQMRFPLGQRSTSTKVDEDEGDDSEGKSTARCDSVASRTRELEEDDDDITPRNSVNQGFLGRGVNLPAAQSSRPPSAPKHGYAQPRSSLQQSIEAWRAVGKADTTIENEDRPISQQKPSSAMEMDDSSSDDDEEEDAGFCGRLAVGPMSARSGRSTSSRIAMVQPLNTNLEELVQTPRLRPSSARFTPIDTSRSLAEEEEEVRTECNEADNETLRSLTEELQVSKSNLEQLDELEEPLLPEQTDLSVTLPPMEGENTMSDVTNNEDESFLNDDGDDFDDKMALAELASELQYTSNTSQQSSVTRTTVKLGNNPRESQVTVASAVTSCWTSSTPSSSSSFNGTTVSNLPAVAEDTSADQPGSSRYSPMPGSSRKQSGMVFNGQSRSKGEFAIRQSSLMGDFDDIEQQLANKSTESDA